MQGISRTPSRVIRLATSRASTNRRAADSIGNASRKGVSDSNDSVIASRPEAPRPHVGPDLLDVGEAIGLDAGPPDGAPARGQRALRRPDRILLFVVHDDLEQLRVLIAGRQPRQYGPWRARRSTSDCGS